MQLSLRQLAEDRRGVAAVEFALLLPVLALLYFGVVELTQGAMTEQRTQHVAATVGDLVAQNSTVTSAQVSDIWPLSEVNRAVSSIAFPFHPASRGS